MKKYKFKLWSKSLNMMIQPEDLAFTYKGGEIINVISTLITLTAPISDYVLLAYTGKNDEYGIEIYDGDVVYFPNCSEHDVVVWNEDNLKYIFRDAWEDVSEFKPSELRVVGNIHNMVKEL